MAASMPSNPRNLATTEHQTAPRSPVRVVVAGSTGRMGRAMTEQLPGESIQIAGTLGRDDDISETLTTSRAEVVVDFTDASYAPTLMKEAIVAGVRPISGTTGFDEGVLDEIDVLARHHHVAAMWAPHFSRSGVLLTQFARIAASYMDSVEIIETHHATKADAPSGTALELVRMMHESLGSDRVASPTQPLVEGAGGVGVHSVRIGDVIGSHELIFFNGTDATFRLRWDALSHDPTVAGVVRAVHAVVRPDMVGLIRGYDRLLELIEP